MDWLTVGLHVHPACSAVVFKVGFSCEASGISQIRRLRGVPAVYLLHLIAKVRLRPDYGS